MDKDAVETINKCRYPAHRVVVAIEPRSNTMKLGVHNDDLAESLAEAEAVFAEWETLRTAQVA